MRTISFKDSMSMCEELGCTYEENMQWCAPEMMPLCNPKEDMLRRVDGDLINLAYSKDEKDREKVRKAVEDYLSER